MVDLRFYTSIDILVRDPASSVTKRRLAVIGTQSGAVVFYMGIGLTNSKYPGLLQKKALSTFRGLLPILLLLLFAIANVAPAAAQTQSQAPSTGDQAPEAGGPSGDTGPMAIPKKKDEPPPERAPSPPKNPEGMPDFSIRVDVPEVTVPVSVVTKDGQFIPGLKKDNFKIFEDGVPQQVAQFNQSEAPITCVLLVEFAYTNYYFMYDAINASYQFANTLRPQDWVAVVSYDMKPHMITDFTQDKREIFAAIHTLQIPGFSETNLFDALYDTLDRVDRLEGRKDIVLISSGIDTFSKLTLDKILKKVKGTPNVTIFTISTGELWRAMTEGRGGLGASIRNLDFIQGDNQMQTFARMTGGRWYHPRFQGELPEVFHDIAGDIRSQYVLTYHPTNAALDGTYRKLKVEVVAPNGGPLEVHDQKGKNLKYQVVAREGYTAKHQVE